MDVLEPKNQVIRKTKDYKVVKLKIKLNIILLVDQMDLHRKNGEMIFINFTNTELNVSKVENMVSKVTNELKKEKIILGINICK